VTTNELTYPRTRYSLRIHPSSIKAVEEHQELTVGIFLPAVELVIDSEGNTLLECALGVRGPSDDVTTHLESHGQVEILRDMRLGPYLLLAVTVDKSGILNGLPPQEAAWDPKPNISVASLAS
jgi:hypothetical protein